MVSPAEGGGCDIIKEWRVMVEKHQVLYLLACIKGVYGKQEKLSLGKEVGGAYEGRADFAGQQKECGHLGSGELQAELWR